MAYVDGMRISLGDERQPDVADGAWIAPNATLTGLVRIAEGASIWYGAVLRADHEPIAIGRDTNVQDNCVFHVAEGFPLTLDDGITVGHNAVVHGASVGHHALIGMGAIIMNGAKIGAESLIAAGALISEGVEIPPRSLVAGVPGKIRRELTEDEIEALYTSARVYTELRDDHRASQIVK